MKKIGLIVVILIALVLVAEFSSPYIVSKGIERGLRRVLGAEVEVNLKSYPSLKLLAGKFDNLNAVAKNVNLGGLQASEYLLIAEDVQVNLSAFLANKGINFAKQSSTQITITVTAADFTRFVWEKIHPLNGWRVEINQGNAVVIGTATILNASVPVRITGKFEAWGKDRVSFVPQQLEVQGTLMPQTMLASMFDKSQFYLDLQAVPMKLELTEVLMTPGKLIIKAKSIP